MVLVKLYVEICAQIVVTKMQIVSMVAIITAVMTVKLEIYFLVLRR